MNDRHSPIAAHRSAWQGEPARPGPWITTAAVFATLRDTISGDDVRRMMSQLPLEFREVADGPRL
ncbi:hypothetical protein ACGFMK_28600 [Amycolatopsis sp. NPDC049252]|uniref:hypothetical protein n=1 Tax=Amycolatopsis sp. NPDC049252 TaxID=3363933 RepID=UPI003712EB6C